MEKSINSKKMPDLTPVESFNLHRYLGKWCEIARFDHRFERGLHNVTADYSLRPDGKIKVANAGFRDGELKQVVGKAKTTSQPGLLRVSFFWIFYADYRVLALGADYEWALVGAGKSTDYLWILSRTPTLPPDTLQQIVSEAQRRGYNTDKLLF